MGKILNDLKCRLIQKTVYGKLYKGHKPNEWEPWETPQVTTLDSGLVCRNDIRFSENYPNSFADIWYPDDGAAIRPVVVYFHGGGFIFGDKAGGDPLSVNAGTAKLLELVKVGFHLVNANYALAPEYRFPTQVRQLDELMRYLVDHAEELRLDMTRVCLAGSSAGANLTEIYGTCVCSGEYADRLGVDPCLTREQLKVLAVDEAALEASVFDKNMYAMLGCWVGAKKNDPKGEIAVINAKNFIHDTFIPTWVNASNEGGETGFFVTEARNLKRKLDSIGVPCEMTWFPDANLPHGYMDQIHTDAHAREAFDTMLAFIQKYI